jgi:hypothetical protein
MLVLFEVSAQKRVYTPQYFFNSPAVHEYRKYVEKGI